MPQVTVEQLRQVGWSEQFIREYFKQTYTHQESPGPSLITAGTITYRTARGVLLQDVSLAVSSSEILGIVGLSGVGKTTLLHILAGLLRPQKGSVTLANPDVVRGMSLQTPSFYDDLTMMENLQFFARLFGVSTTQQGARIQELVKTFSLSPFESILAKQLSGGVRKKLDLAIALLNDPDVLFLDEPTGELDQRSRAHLWSLLSQLKEQGKAIVVASQQLHELETVCTRIGVLHNKNFLDIGTLDHLRERFPMRYVLRVELESHRYDQLLQQAKCQVDGQHVLFFANKQEDIVAFLRTVTSLKDTIVHLSLDRPSLTNLFNALVT